MPPMAQHPMTSKPIVQFLEIIFPNLHKIIPHLAQSELCKLHVVWGSVFSSTNVSDAIAGEHHDKTSMLIGRECHLPKLRKSFDGDKTWTRGVVPKPPRLPTTTSKGDIDYRLQPQSRIRISCYKDRMVSIDEELEAALAALATIHTLSTSSPKPHIVTALRKAKLAAGPITDFTSNASIVETRDKVVNALSDLI